MDTKGLQKEFINWCKSNKKQPKSKEETQQLFVTFMKEKHPEEYKAAMENQQKQAQKALHGAKLQYIRSLKNQCPEGEELYYYKKGGSVSCGCKKKENGGEVVKAQSGGTAVDKFKNDQKKKQQQQRTITVTKEQVEENKKQNKELKNGTSKLPQDNAVRDRKDNKENIVKKFKSARCGSKMKKHQQGGSLNGIPFIRKVQ